MGCGYGFPFDNSFMSHPCYIPKIPDFILQGVKLFEMGWPPNFFYPPNSPWIFNDIKHDLIERIHTYLAHIYIISKRELLDSEKLCVIM